MTDDEITLRLLEVAETREHFCLHDSAIVARFGDVGDGPRVRQIALDIMRPGAFGVPLVEYDLASEHIIPLTEDVDGDVPDVIPAWLDKLMHDGAMRFTGLTRIG